MRLERTSILLFKCVVPGDFLNFEAVEQLENSPSKGKVTPSAELRRERLSRLLNELPRIAGNPRRGAQSFPHPFPARMPFNVAKTIATGLCFQDDFLLDPMVGSGTSLKVAASLGCRAVGYDMDPLAIHLARAFADPPSGSILRQAAMRVVITARELQLTTDLSLFLNGLNTEGRKFVDYWFTEEAAHALFCLAASLRNIETTETRSALIALFSSTIIARSAGVSLALDLARSRPHRNISKSTRDPFEVWMRKLHEFEHFCVSEPRRNGIVQAQIGDARFLPIGDAQVDVIMTSPPYLNAIDYIRTSKFSLVFLGHKLADLRTIRSGSIGTEVGLHEDGGKSQLEATLLKSVKDDRRRAIIGRYLVDMNRTLKETYRVLKPGGVAIFAVGPSMISRSKYDGGVVLSQLADSVGYSIVGVARRDLSSSNRSLPPPKRNSRSEAIHRRMACELYVGLQRPAISSQAGADTAKG